MAETVRRMAVAAALVVGLVACKPAPVDPKPCKTERRTIETAAEAYHASTGAKATSLADVAPFLKAGTTTTWWTISPSGAVVPKAGVTLPAGCA